jgi:hypothetical protein
MKVAELILEFLKVLIWPIATVLLLREFRKELISMLPRHREAKLPGGVSLSFEAELNQAKEISEAVKEAPPPKHSKQLPRPQTTDQGPNGRLVELGLAPSPSNLDLNYYRAIAQHDANLALAGIRMELETAGRNLAKGFSVTIKENDSISALYSRLQSAGAIYADQAELTRKVLRLCNLAVHGQSVSADQAEEVISLAGLLLNDYVSWLSWGFENEADPNAA